MTVQYVNHAESSQTGTSSVTGSFSNSGGNCLLANFFGLFSGSGMVPDSVSDSAGNTWTKIKDDSGVSFWIALDIAADAANVVTVAWPNASTYTNILIGQFSGVDKIVGYDSAYAPATLHDTGGSPPWTSNSDTTTHDDELIVCFWTSDNFWANPASYSTSVLEVVHAHNDLAIVTNQIDSAGSADTSMTNTGTGSADGVWSFPFALLPQRFIQVNQAAAPW